MPYDVGDALAHHPAQQRLGLRRQRRAGLGDAGLDAGRLQEGAGAVEFRGQAALAVAGDGLADLGERLPADGLDVGGLAERGVQVAGGEAAYGLGLDDDHGHGVAEQVVQVAGEAEPFPFDGAARQFLAGVAELAHGLEEGDDHGDDHAGEQGAVPHERRVAPVAEYSGDGPGRAGEDDHREAQGALRAAQRDARADRQQEETVGPLGSVADGEGVDGRGLDDEEGSGQAGVAALVEAHGDGAGVADREDEEPCAGEPGQRRLALGDIDGVPADDEEPRQEGPLVRPLVRDVGQGVAHAHDLTQTAASWADTDVRG